MPAALLSLAVAAIVVAGLAWILAPLVRRPSGFASSQTDDDQTAIERSLRMLDEMEAERDRGAMSASDFAQVSGELRREAAARLHARDQRTARLDAALDALLTRADGEPPPPSTAARPRAHALVWVAPAITAAALLAVLVVVITVGARASAAEQTVVGNVGVGAVTGLAVAADDADTLAAAHAAGVQVSRDGGRSWAAADVPGPAAAAAAARGRLYALTDAGVWTSADRGLTWTRDADRPPLRLLAAGPRGGRLAAVGPAGEIVVSDDAGTTWRGAGLETPPALSGLAVVDFAAPFLLAATGTEGVLAESSGGRWRSANGFVNGALPTVVVRAVAYAPDTGDAFTSATGERFEGAVFAATDAGVFKSVDGMQSWQLLPLRADVRALGVSPAAPRTLYAVGLDGSVFRSLDAGAAWR